MRPSLAPPPAGHCSAGNDGRHHRNLDARRLRIASRDQDVIDVTPRHHHRGQHDADARPHRKAERTRKKMGNDRVLFRENGVRSLQPNAEHELSDADALSKLTVRDSLARESTDTKRSALSHSVRMEMLHV